MGAQDGSRPNTIYYYKTSGGLTDCTATYSTNGTLNIPCVTVPNDSGGKTLYQAVLQLIPSSNPLSFELTSAQQKGNVSLANSCVSTFNSDGTLSIPCVTVPDNPGSTTLYQANMKLIPSSNPFRFDLTQASKK
ncbi:MAG: hypothetical protein V3U75_10060 [Methylococcaceae bacterium]